MSVEIEKALKRYHLERFINLLLSVQRGHCFYCDKKFNREIRKSALTVDHFVPKSRMGYNGSHYDNAVLACRGCNARKGNRMPTEEEWHKFLVFQCMFMLLYGDAYAYLRENFSAKRDFYL